MTASTVMRSYSPSSSPPKWTTPKVALAPQIFGAKLQEDLLAAHPPHKFRRPHKTGAGDIVTTTTTTLLVSTIRCICAGPLEVIWAPEPPPGGGFSH